MASMRSLPGQYRARVYNAEYSEFKEIREYSEIDIRAILPKNIATLAPQPYFLSEVVRLVLDMKFLDRRVADVALT